MRKIKFLVMDVDGTLTDGKIYMGEANEVAKAFDIKDGAGIKLLLPKLGIIPIIITARESKIVENRCKEIGINEIYQNSKDKLTTLREILDRKCSNLSDVAYVGDDLPDIPCMEEVKKAGGLIMAPADAIQEIKTIAEYVSGFDAGKGAIRDCINYITQKNESNVENKIKECMEWIISKGYEKNQNHEGFTYSIQEYETKTEEKCVLESHRKHIDIQYIIEGNEEIKTYSTDCLTKGGEYDKNRDVDCWQGGIVATHTILSKGSLIVIFNNQPHKGAIIHDKSVKVKKLVCKIKV